MRYKISFRIKRERENSHAKNLTIFHSISFSISYSKLFVNSLLFARKTKIACDWNSFWAITKAIVEVNANSNTSRRWYSCWIVSQEPASQPASQSAYTYKLIRVEQNLLDFKFIARIKYVPIADNYLFMFEYISFHLIIIIFFLCFQQLGVAHSNCMSVYV